jgi:hypothetical protein
MKFKKKNSKSNVPFNLKKKKKILKNEKKKSKSHVPSNVE